MLKITIIVIKLFLYSFMSMSSEFYNFQFESIEGNKMPLKDYKGKVVLLVNTASMCGFTKQYSGLQELHEEYKDKGLIVLGVPSNSFKQEHTSEDKVKDFSKFTILPSDNLPKVVHSKVSFEISTQNPWSVNSTTVKHTPLTDILAPISTPSSSKLFALIKKRISSNCESILATEPFSWIIPVNIEYPS